MRSRRVPVLRLGSRGPGGDARSLHLRSQASAIVRGGWDMPERRKSSRNAELSALFYVSYYKSVNSHRDRGGPCCETQNCRHFWTRLGSSRLTSVNSHRDRGVLFAKRRTVVTFGLISGLRISKVSTFTGIGGVLVAKRRTVVTIGLVSGLRVSTVSTVTGIGGVLFAKRRTVALLDSPLERGKDRGERRKER